jgi:hypothetical protein
LGIESSGNLDHHLKKLGELITVREDGLYALSDAGREALLSVEAVESWARMSRHGIRVPSKIPRQVMLLGSLEVAASFAVFYFLTAFYKLSNWGYLPPVALLLGGLGATFGLFTQQWWSWRAVLVKSAAVFSMGLLLLNYSAHSGGISLSTPTIFYLVFIAAEATIIVLTLRRPLQDFLDIHKAGEISPATAIASLLCIFSGVLLIAMEMTVHLGGQVDFAGFMGDVTILAALVIIIGGVLILVKSYIPGALLSMLCGIYPPRSQNGFHAYDFINEVYGFPAGKDNPLTLLVAITVGLLPIIGGAIAMYIVARRIRIE